jgi:hypothetical protein
MTQPEHWGIWGDQERVGKALWVVYQGSHIACKVGQGSEEFNGPSDEEITDVVRAWEDLALKK